MGKYGKGKEPGKSLLIDQVQDSCFCDLSICFIFKVNYYSQLCYRLQFLIFLLVRKGENSDCPFFNRLSVYKINNRKSIEIFVLFPCLPSNCMILDKGLSLSVFSPVKHSVCLMCCHLTCPQDRHPRVDLCVCSVLRLSVFLFFLFISVYSVPLLFG